MTLAILAVLGAALLLVIGIAPFVGFLGHQVGTLRALTAAAGLVTVGVLISGVLRPERVAIAFQAP